LVVYAFAFDSSQLQAAPRAFACPWPILPVDIRRLFECGIFINSLEIMGSLQAILAPRIGRMRFSSSLPTDDEHKANLRFPGASCATI
jgi:hypothetical protein